MKHNPSTQSLGFSFPFHLYTFHNEDSEQAVGLLTIWLRRMGIWTAQLTTSFLSHIYDQRADIRSVYWGKSLYMTLNLLQ